MRVKPWRQWSDDALWITFAITITLASVVIAYLVMPP